MALADYEVTPLPGLVFFCDLSHPFSELLTMGDSRHDPDSRGHYIDNKQANQNDKPSFLVYRTKFTGFTKFTDKQLASHAEPITKPKASHMRPTGNTWEFSDSVTFYCAKCDLKSLSVSKKNLADWLDPLIDQERLKLGKQNDYLVSLSDVWAQFEGLDNTTLKSAIKQRHAHL